jgi:hypothetical protein
MSTNPAQDSEGLSPRRLPSPSTQVLSSCSSTKTIQPTRSFTSVPCTAPTATNTPGKPIRVGNEPWSMVISP